MSIALPVEPTAVAERPATVSVFMSQKFKFWSFASMFLLVFVHGYNLHTRYLQPWTLPDDPLTTTTFTEYWLANGLFRFRIPMLFIISGYLFAITDYRPYGQRTRKRLKSLLRPYLLWSAIGLLGMYAMEFFPYTRQIITDTHMSQIDETRLYMGQYQWYEWVLRWIFGPPGYQLWFIRALLIYNLAYPVIAWAVTNRYMKWLWFPVMIWLFISTWGFIFVEGEGLLFFSLGIWMQKSAFDIEKPKAWFKPGIWGLVFIIASLVKTLLAFKGMQWLGGTVYPLITLLHKLVVFSGLIAAWYGLNPLVRWFMSKSWFVQLSAFSFFIYAFHAPLVALTIDPFFSLVQSFQLYRILTFLLQPLLIIALAVTIGWILRRYTPGIYSWLTGGRGLN